MCDAMSRPFPTWAGTVLPPETPYLLVLEKPRDVWEVCWELLHIGYDLSQRLARGRHAGLADGGLAD
jgi:hypothetical protein